MVIFVHACANCKGFLHELHLELNDILSVPAQECGAGSYQPDIGTSSCKLCSEGW
jgi:hypothetical protein